jgi:hypothetical protein
VLLFVGVALGSLLLLAAVYAARTVLVQLVVAIVLAMAEEPLVQALQRRGLRRGTAVGASFALVHLGSLDARPPRAACTARGVAAAQLPPSCTRSFRAGLRQR